MKPISHLFLFGAGFLGLGLAACNQEATTGQQRDTAMDSAPADPTATASSSPEPDAPVPAVDESAALQEADALLSAAAASAGTTREALMKARAAGRFSRAQNVFFPSTVAIDFQRKHVTLPLYKGVGPGGGATYYIITEAADFAVAQRLGVNYAPKLAHGRGTEGSQPATLANGQLRFAGDVDFKPERVLKPGVFPNTFPPAMAQPGSVADSQYSPLVVLPSGSVLNASIVANGTGKHDHAVSVDYQKGTVVFELLDGFEGGQQYYYHIVTESSDKGAATIERGTFTPRLGKLPAFGKNLPADQSALLGFAPVANGETGAANPERQGLNSTILDGNAYDPINVFPLDPDNGKREANNYSPMWDAHIYVWTPAAVQAGQRKRLKSVADLEQALKAGLIMNAPANMGAPNQFLAGLKPTGAVINCAVIAQPTNP